MKVFSLIIFTLSSLSSAFSFPDDYTSSGAFTPSSFSGSLLNPNPLLRRQTETCSLPQPNVNCADGATCCPASSPVCCPALTCCPTTSYCYTTGKCCPKSAATCGKGFCLPPGATCCGDGFCPAGVECVNGKCGSESVSTATVSSSAPTSSASCAPHSDSSSSRKRQTADDPGDFILVNGKCVPAMDFPCVDGLSEQLCESMCRGIAQMKTSSKAAGVLGDNAMALTYTGKRNADPGCVGFCSGQTDAQGDKMQCDEFPPAVTSEGGPGSHKFCISWKQNSGLQGPMMKQYRRFYNIQPGQTFVIRIPDCSKWTGGVSKRVIGSLPNNIAPANQPPAVPNAGGKTLSTTTTQFMRNPAARNSSGYLVIPLFNTVAGGSYRGTLTLSTAAGLANLAVLDSEGEEYWTGDPEVDVNVDFQAPEREDLVIAADVEGDPSPTITARFEATQTGSITSGGRKLGKGNWWMVVVTLASVVVGFW